MKNANPIPIHLHLQQAKQRNEFSPFSLHGDQTVKDSINVQSRRSKEKNYELSRGDEDGICTVRAESHLEAGHLLHSYLKKNSTGQKSMHNH